MNTKTVVLICATVVTLLGVHPDASAQPSVAITITTVPPGQTISVDGTNYIAPTSFDWLSASSHTLVAASPQTATDGHSRNVFASWSDGGPQTNVIFVPSSPTNYTATFSTQYLLDVAVTPASTGTVTNSPAGPWYDAGQLVSLVAKTNAGYRFLFWTGVVDSQTSHTAQVTMSGYRSVTATFATSDTLPAPPITVHLRDNPAPGNILMATWDRNNPHKYDNYLFVLDNQGNILNYLKVDGAPFDFQQQPNGQFSFALGDFAGAVPGPEDDLRHYVLDANLTVIDSFQMKHGYPTDFHEFLLLPNGHALMMSYYSVMYDMSTIVPDGKPDAELVLNIIQEQDRDKNVVFEWRNIDHIPITDSDLNLTAGRINYGTLNAFELDHDGDILASFRNHSEIMKISRTTGEVLWRWGSPRGEFTFVGEHEENAPYYFARQHDIRRLPNGNVSMFDNGEFHSPPYSRSVEYALDEANKIATLVSEYRYPTGNIFTATAGSAQPVPGGGWFLSYGVTHPVLSSVKLQVVEYHADGSPALELSIPNGVLAYRARKVDLSSPPITVSHSGLVAGQTYIFDEVDAVTGVALQIDAITGPGNLEATVTREDFAPLDPYFAGKAPRVLPVRVTITGSGIESLIAEVVFDAMSFGFADENGVFGYVDPNALTVYHRPAGGGMAFVPLETQYDSGEQQLQAATTELGEFILGFADPEEIPNPPILIAPTDQSSVNQEFAVDFSWTPRGFARVSHLQVARDAAFTDLVVDEPLLEYRYTWLSASPNMTYFYRVRIWNDGGQSEWSTASFQTVAPRILITTPNGGEVWQRGLDHYILWEDNLEEDVVIELYKGGAFVQTVATVPSIGAYEWEVDLALAAGTDYSMKISSATNAVLSDMSDSEFSLDMAEFTSITATTNGAIVLGWAGSTYNVYIDFTPTLSPTTWTNIAGPIYDTSWTDASLPMTSGFYRLRVE